MSIVELARENHPLSIEGAMRNIERIYTIHSCQGSAHRKYANSDLPSQ